MFDESTNRVIVMGLARSGQAAAKLLLEHGYDVIVNDQKQPDNTAEIGLLRDLGASFVFGSHPLELLSQPVKFIVKNPGIPYRVPFLQEALRQSIPIYTEVEVASWFAEGPIAAITGSNGKTTTTTLVGEMLRAADSGPLVAGNIGTAFSAVVRETAPHRVAVLEVSSFQLLGTEKFHPHVAAILNLYPAHLDYHGEFEAYVDAKWKIFANLTGEDYAVLNHEDARLVERSSRLSVPIFWFTTGELPSGASGACIEQGEIVVRQGGKNISIAAVSDVALPGRHNLQNALAATAVAWLLGADEAAIRSVLVSFRGVEHRIEYVDTRDGARYYNDSKSTNPTAALQALQSFSQPIVWIAGGLDRKDDYSVLSDVVQGHVKAAVLYGQTAADLAAFCQNCGVPIVKTVANLSEAVGEAAEISSSGDVVLLSPACASWDMFSSFEERGRMFKEVVHRL